MINISVTNKGKREINQDLILEYQTVDGSYLFAVIDGMGGYKNGEIAARTISENIKAYLSTVDTINSFHIQKAINKSSLAIRQQKSAFSENMGATLGGVILKDTNASYFWVGDVKILHFRDKKLIFESKPHSLVSELINNGSITKPSHLSKYRHVVTRCIQGDSKISHAEIVSAEFIKTSDLLIICSDGVHDLFDSLQIENIYSNFDNPEKLSEFLKLKLEKMADDNFSYEIIFSKHLMN